MISPLSRFRPIWVFCSVCLFVVSVFLVYPFESAKAQLIGQWCSVKVEQPNHPQEAWQITFDANGSFSMIRDEGFGIAEPSTGTYSINKESLQLRKQSAKKVESYKIDTSKVGHLALSHREFTVTFVRSSEPHPELVDMPGPPKTLKEAIGTLQILLPPEVLRTIAGTRRDNLGRFHMGLGQYIRNGFGLWRDNTELIRDINGGELMHPDNASGLILQAVWDELHKDEDIPKFESSPATEYFQAIDQYLRVANESQSTKPLLHLPSWVLQDSFRYLVMQDERSHVELRTEAFRLASESNPLRYLGLLYLSTFDPTEKSIALMESALNDPTRVPIPRHLESENREATIEDRFNWPSATLSEIAVRMLGFCYEKPFSSAAEYTKWKNEVETDELLRWKFRPELTDDDLNELLATPLHFARVLALTRRWITFEVDGHHPQLTEEGLALIRRLGEVIPANEEKQFAYDQRKQRGIRLFQIVLEGVPIDEQLAAVQIAPRPHDVGWIQRGDTLTPDHLAAAIFHANESALPTAEKRTTWERLNHHRELAKVSWGYKAYLTQQMFAVDYERTDELVHQLFDPRPLPTERRQVSNRIQVLTVMIDDHFPYYRNYIKELFFAAQEVYDGDGRDYIYKIYNRIIGKDPDKEALYYEIKSDPRYIETD